MCFTCGRGATRRWVVCWPALRVRDSIFERRTALERVRAAMVGRKKTRRRKNKVKKIDWLILLARMLMLDERLFDLFRTLCVSSTNQRPYSTVRRSVVGLSSCILVAGRGYAYVYQDVDLYVST